ncbi:MAG: SDR family oxidoreductase [Nocardioidaceae bacterium]|nr:SDR family oxidoreductase [Nocardioidaceae bacterium]
MANPLIVVIGAGPGIGTAVARRFGQAGYDCALVARDPAKLESLGRQLQSEGLTTGWSPVDVTDSDALARAITAFARQSGEVKHVHFNPSAYTDKDALELTADELLADVRLGVASLLTAVQAARPFMQPGARVTATGGGSADKPSKRAASLGVQKAALRNLVTALDARLAADEIRACSLTVAGTIRPGTAFDPALIAEAIYTASQSESEFWEAEVRFDGRSEHSSTRAD